MDCPLLKASRWRVTGELFNIIKALDIYLLSRLILYLLSRLILYNSSKRYIINKLVEQGVFADQMKTEKVIIIHRTTNMALGLVLVITD